MRHFKIISSTPASTDLIFHHIYFDDSKAGKATGRSATINLTDVAPRIFIFDDLVNNNFYAVGKSNSPRLPNYGMSIAEFINNEPPSQLRISSNELQRCLFASNTLHTNFVRGSQLKPEQFVTPVTTKSAKVTVFKITLGIHANLQLPTFLLNHLI